MIDIQEIKEISAEIRAFQKSEWEYADMEYFGEKIDWTRKKIIFTATDNDDLIGVLECNIMAGVMNIESLIVKHTNIAKE